MNDTAQRNFWTPERQHKLVELWSSGLTAKQVASQLGCKSRCAVLGKINRLGLPKRPQRSQFQMTRRERRELSQKTTAWKKPAGHIRTAPIAIVEPDATPVLFKLIDWPETACRQPYTDDKGNHRFGCTCQKLQGLPYCAGHANRNFREPLAAFERPQNRATVANQIIANRTYELADA